MDALANPALTDQNTRKVNIDLETAVQIGKAAAPLARSMAQGAKDIGSTFEIK